MKKLVFSFGRMNPPTAGHQKLVDKVKSVAKTAKADARIYLSHTQNKKKDPLDYQDKIRFATKAFGSIVTKSQSKTIIQILQEIESAGYTDVVLVVGSDRVKDFDALLKKYNGKDYTFNSVRTQSAGTRDPDAEGVEGMSASKLRQLATEGNFNEFKSGLPKSIQTMAKAIYDKLRSVMEEDDKQLDEAVLTIQQRQKRARMMKRLARKMKSRRAMRKTRMADRKRLEKRARKKAVEFLRKKFAGDRGRHYSELGPAEKIAVDKLIDKKRGMIAKIAKKLMPKVRKGEVERVRAARSSKNEQVQEQVEMTKTFKTMFSEGRPGPSEVAAKQKIAKEKQQDAIKHDRLMDRARMSDTRMKNRMTEGGEAADFDMDPEDMAKRKSPPAPTYYQRNGVKTMKDMPRLKVQDENPPAGLRLAHLDVKGEQNLREKAEKAGVEFEVILSIYEQATIDPTSANTEEQQRFQAVNHYVAEAISPEMKDKLKKAADTLQGGMEKIYGKHTVRGLQKANREVLGVKKQKTYSEMMQKNEDINEGKVADVANKLSDYVLRTTGLGTTNAKGEKIVYTGKVPTQDKKEDADPCWKGYQQIGTKKKDGKEVPNCVPKEEVAEAKATKCGRCGTTHVPPEKGGTCPALSKEENARRRQKMNEEKQIDEIGIGIVGRYLAKRIGQSLTKKAGTPSKKSIDTQIQNTANAKKRIDQHYGGKPQLVQSPAPTKPTGTVKSIQTTSSKRPMPASTRTPANEGVSPEKAKKRLSDVLPKSGAGQDGTDELVKTYKSQTPGQGGDLNESYGPVYTARDMGIEIQGAFAYHPSVEELVQTDEAVEVDEALKMARGEVFRQMKAFLSDYIDKAGDKELVHVAKMMGKTLTKQGAKYVLEHMETAVLEESEYQGKKVTLNDPFRTPDGPKKFSVYVKNEKGNVVKVNFGDPNMEIKRDDPERRKAYRSRHGCDNPGPKTKANYWSCQQWRAGKKVDD